MVDPENNKKTKSNNSGYFSRVQAILYSYPGMETAINTILANIKMLDLDRMPSSTPRYDFNEGGRSTGDHMTEPESFADKRIRAKAKLNARLELLQAQQAGVKAAYDSLGEELRLLVKVTYFDNFRLNNPGKRVWRELGYPKPKYLELRNQVVELVARWLGEAVNLDVEDEEGGEVSG